MIIAEWEIGGGGYDHWSGTQGFGFSNGKEVRSGTDSQDRQTYEREKQKDHQTAIEFYISYGTHHHLQPWERV